MRTAALALFLLACSEPAIDPAAEPPDGGGKGDSPTGTTPRTTPTTLTEPAYDWIKIQFGITRDHARDVTTDHAGNVIEVGEFQSREFDLQGVVIDVSPIDPTNTRYSVTDVYIIKYAADGTPLWRQTIGGGFAEAVGEVTTDAAGNIFIAGSTISQSLQIGALSVPTPAATMVWRPFLVKLAPDGTVLWVRHEAMQSQPAIRALPGLHFQSLAVDAAGDVYVTGELLRARVTIAGTAFDAGERSDVVLAKYAADGTPLWATQFVGSGFEDIGALVLDSDGLYLAGTSDSATLAIGGLVEPQPQDVVHGPFVAKLDHAGQGVWLRRFGGTYRTDQAQSIAVDHEHNVFFAGTFRSQVFTVGHLTVANNNPDGVSYLNEDMYLAKLDPMGTPLWLRTAVNSRRSDDRTQALIADDHGYAYLLAAFSHDLTLGGVPVTNYETYPDPGTDSFVAMYDADGNVVWVKPVHGARENVARNLTRDAAGNLFVVGDFEAHEGGMVFDGVAHHGYGMGLMEDAFLAKLANE